MPDRKTLVLVDNCDHVDERRLTRADVVLLAGQLLSLSELMEQ